MKLLVDMNLPPKFADLLVFDCIKSDHWYKVGVPDASDLEIMRYALEHDYIVVTCDLDFSAILSATHGHKPSIVQVRARNLPWGVLADINTLEYLLSAYNFTANEYVEENGSVTLSLVEIDLIENGKDKQEALVNLSNAIMDYSHDYYNDFAYWARGDRKQHMPLVFKALVINDVDKIGGMIQCRHGEI